ncbi:keywimysin-related RiPP [Desulfosarcina ovata]
MRRTVYERPVLFKTGSFV